MQRMQRLAQKSIRMFCKCNVAICCFNAQAHTSCLPLAALRAAHLTIATHALLMHVMYAYARACLLRHACMGAWPIAPPPSPPLTPSAPNAPLLHTASRQGAAARGWTRHVYLTICTANLPFFVSLTSLISTRPCTICARSNLLSVRKNSTLLPCAHIQVRRCAPIRPGFLTQ